MRILPNHKISLVKNNGGSQRLALLANYEVNLPVSWMLRENMGQRQRTSFYGIKECLRWLSFPLKAPWGNVDSPGGYCVQSGFVLQLKISKLRESPSFIMGYNLPRPSSRWEIFIILDSKTTLPLP